ncbi:hypothetical protein BKA80DRAFT_333388 [Phyllosticta citrichinensis]
MSETSDTSETQPSPSIDSSSESDFDSRDADVLTPSTGSSEPSGSRRRPHVCMEQERIQDYYSHGPDAATPSAGGSEPSVPHRRRRHICKEQDRIRRRRDDRDERAERRPMMEATETQKERNGGQRLGAGERWRQRHAEEKRRRELDLFLLHEDNAKLRKDVEELKEKVDRLSEAAVNAATPFNPHDIGFYEKDYGYGRSCSVNHMTWEGRLYYLNIEFFIDAVLMAAERIPEQVIRNNLQHCLLGDACTWYSSILTADQREELTKGDGLSDWIGLLRQKWGMTTDDAFQKLASLEITDDDVKKDQNFAAKFVIYAVQIGRRIGMDTTFLQLTLAYTRLKPEMQAKVKPPAEDETVEDFIEKLRVLKLD